MTCARRRTVAWPGSSIAASAPAGRSYGYRSEPHGNGHRMVIDPSEAPIVREVFNALPTATGVRMIVHELNARGITSARGGTWAVSALQGSSAKGLGMLNNQLYIGRVVWNKRQWLKDPDTGAAALRLSGRSPSGRCVRHPSCASSTSRCGMPCRTGHERARRAAPAPARGAIPKTLFGGLLRWPRLRLASGVRQLQALRLQRAPRSGQQRVLEHADGYARRRRSPAGERAARRAAAAGSAGRAAGAVRSLVTEAQRDANAGTGDARSVLAVLQSEIARLVDAGGQRRLSRPCRRAWRPLRPKLRAWRQAWPARRPRPAPS